MAENGNPVRRRIAPAYRINVTLDSTEADKLKGLAAESGVFIGTLAREAIKAGLPAVERMVENAEV